jgi:Na+-driven multidrug efflux pump
MCAFAVTVDNVDDQACELRAFVNTTILGFLSVASPRLALAADVLVSQRYSVRQLHAAKPCARRALLSTTSWKMVHWIPLVGLRTSIVSLTSDHEYDSYTRYQVVLCVGNH